MNVPKEIKLTSMIYPQRKKMSSKDCLLKHLRDKEFQGRIKSRVERKKVLIVKAKDVR